MPDESGYPRTRVDSGSTEEVVIQAGAVAAQGQPPAPEHLPSKSQAGPSAAAGDDTGDSGSLADLAADEQERQRLEQHVRQRAAKRQQNAMLTTEDDLRAKTPFARMRAGIIVAAVLLIVLFALYWLYVRPAG